MTNKFDSTKHIKRSNGAQDPLPRPSRCTGGQAVGKWWASRDQLDTGNKISLRTPQITSTQLILQLVQGTGKHTSCGKIFLILDDGTLDTSICTSAV